MSPTLFWTYLTLTCGYALWRGTSDARITAAVCIAASVISSLVMSPWADRYSGVESGELIVDGLVLVAFIAIALRSNSFWPLWIAGLQLTSGFGHLFKLVDIDLIPQAYAAATRVWSYPILLILAIGTWRGHQRRQKEPSDFVLP